MLDQPSLSLPVARLETLNRDGLARFRVVGWPQPREEAWRFTNPAPLSAQAFQPATSSATAPDGAEMLPLSVLAASGVPCHRLVFINGQWAPALSAPGVLPDGVVLTGLAAALVSQPAVIEPYLGQLAPALEASALVALNGGHCCDGPVVIIPSGVTLADPIELVMISRGQAGQPQAYHPRALIVAGAGSQATVIEHHLCLNQTPSLTNLVTELSVAASATLRHYQVQQGGEAALSHATLCGRLEGAAHYHGLLLTFGSRLNRTELRLTLAGREANASFNAAYLLRGTAHSEINTLIDHAEPDGTSRQLVKGVIDQRGHGVFQGKVLVRPQAQHTDGRQLHRALLLSDQARIDAKPELEIFADDVKCSHGATVGDLDEEALFYLRARGIDPEGARALLIGAYVNEVLAAIDAEPVRTAFEALAAGWLNSGP